MLAIILPFSMVKSLEKLSNLSSFGLVTCSIGLIITLIASIWKICISGISDDMDYWKFEFTSLISFFGSILLMYDVNGIYTEIRSEMK